jgi:divalent metal cation (Fe/Co/Zn/Cd) transporter
MLDWYLDSFRAAGALVSTHPFSENSLHEKKSAALGSVIAAVALTVFKIVVGFSTGSLGILAEAAHSGLDLMAAVMTFLAVRFS